MIVAPHCNSHFGNQKLGMPSSIFLSTFPLASPRSRYRWGVGLLTVGLGMSAGLIVLAHPIFALGVWEDSQPMGIALFVAAGLCMFGLGILAPQSRLTRRAILHPLSLVSSALAVWSLLVAPLADHPIRSLLGAAENAQGALWYLALAAFTAAALVLGHTRWAWRSVLAITAVSTALATLLGLRGLTWLYSPLVDWHLLPPASLLHFNEYLADAALSLLALTASMKQSGRYRSAWLLGIIAITALLVSRNRTAYLAFPMIIFAFFGLRKHLAADKRTLIFLSTLILLAGIVPLGAVCLLDNANVNFSGTLWSRAVIVRTLIPSLSDGLLQLLAGHGWGSTPDIMIRHLASSRVRLFESEWGGLERDIFHSHNATLEALLAAGPLAAVMAALLPAACLFNSRRLWLTSTFAACWAVLDGFWFMVPANLPFIALGVACLSARPKLRRRLSPIWIAGATLVLGVAYQGTAAALYSEAFQESHLARCLESTNCDKPTPPLDLRGGGHALASLLASALKTDLEMDSQLPVSQAEAFRFLQQQTEVIADAEESPSLSMALLNAISTEAFVTETSPLAWRDQESLSSLWEHDLRRLLNQTPERLDVLAPYLSWLLARHHDNQLRAMITYAQGIDRDHPVVLWFAGALLLQAPEVERQTLGLQYMRSSLQKGLERFMPVEPKIKEDLGYPMLR